uniref:NADH-ubiquinone oxidoreductase chain 1 n=1 Tax=Stenus clavicornis TaxID=1202167 RepID=A0A191ZS14_9COLE|nr:NADH dehydrogenase subunit 1 [Stenus clavicornis]
MFLKDMIMNFMSFIILILMVLISVAFLTLLERKILGYIQIRKGPNKVGLMGLLQPFSDGIKLFSKEIILPLKSNLNLYYFSPVMNLMLSLFMWLCMPFFSGFIMFNMGLLFFLCCSSVSVYTIMIVGWSSNSVYSLLGSLRSIAQMISYEVSLFLIILSYLVLILSLNLSMFYIYQKMVWLMFFTFPISLIWLISSMAETNRTPFDFAEGESELVSGFNIEYSSGGFAMIFLAEYSSILFMSMMSVLFFLGGNINSIFFFLKLSILSFFWIWVRGSLPRFRYDKLMNLAWKSFLPVSLNYLMFYFSLKIFFLSFII